MVIPDGVWRGEVIRTRSEVFRVRHRAVVGGHGERTRSGKPPDRVDGHQPRRQVAEAIGS